MSDWTVVIPVKGTSGSKSRLGGSAALAAAIALDTVAAALTALPTAVIVVTAPTASDDFRSLGAIVVDDPGTGLEAAIARGIETAGRGPVAVVLGDLPALAGEELARALALAEEHPLAMVADADGVGTVLIAARSGSDHRPAFGGASRAAHLAAGYVELTVPVSSGLRRDVDTADQLAFLTGRLGPRTAALAARGPA